MFRPVVALVLDVVAVVLFVIIGLSQHGEPLSVQNISWVAWPFLAGVLLGQLAIRAWRAPFAIWPQGVFVWAITFVTGMLLRTLLQMGTQPSFMIVTACVTALFLLGWRGIALLLTRREQATTA